MFGLIAQVLQRHATLVECRRERRIRRAVELADLNAREERERTWEELAAAQTVSA